MQEFMDCICLKRNRRILPNNQFIDKENTITKSNSSQKYFKNELNN